jgi:hypothetical protein
LSVVPFSVSTRLASETASNVTGGMAIAVPTRPLWSPASDGGDGRSLSHSAWAIRISGDSFQGASG